MFNRSRFRQRFDGATVAGLTEGTLVAPYVFAAPLTLSRAQTGGARSSAISGNGSSVALYNADTPRFNGSAQRLLIEGQRTNHVMQPIAVASATGAWTQFGGTATPTITRDYAVAPNDTQTAARVRWVGPGTVGATLRVPITGFPASTTGTVSFYIFVRSLGNATFISTDIMDGVTIFLPAGSIQLNTWLRLTNTQTSGTGAQHIDFGMWDYTTGDVDFDLWGVQVEEASFASSLIIPPAATPGASTRGTDLISPTLASLGVTNGITMLWSGLIPAAPAVAGEQTILQVDDGALNSRYRLINEGVSGNILLSRSFGGGAANAVTPGGVRPTNSIFKIGMSVDIPAGTAISSLNGGAVATVTGGAASGLTHFRLGNALAAAPLFGETARLRVLPYATSSSDLQSLVSALP